MFKEGETMNKRAKELNLTPVYLRDISDECQCALRETSKWNKLLSIVESQGKDIIVGYYLDVQDFEIED